MQMHTQTHAQGPQTQSLQSSCTNMDTQALSLRQAQFTVAWSVRGGSAGGGEVTILVSPITSHIVVNVNAFTDILPTFIQVHLVPLTTAHTQ